MQNFFFRSDIPFFRSDIQFFICNKKFKVLTFSNQVQYMWNKNKFKA